MFDNLQRFYDFVAQIIYNRKGFNTVAIDVENVSSITNCFFIAEGNVPQHVKSIAKEIVEELKKHGEKLVCIEGMQNGDWIVLDYLHTVIHIFVPEMRAKYNIEELCKDGKAVDLNLSLKAGIV
jgi:ribosome-associated protein